MAVTFFFTRHGETRFNVENRVQGWCDSPLTPKGLYGAYKLGQGLASIEFVGACTSDAGRAQNTLSVALEARENERRRSLRNLSETEAPIGADQMSLLLDMERSTLREQALAFERDVRARGCLRSSSRVSDGEAFVPSLSQRLGLGESALQLPSNESWRPLLSGPEWTGYPARALDAPSCGPAVPVRCDARLREWCFGDLEGEPARRLRNRMFDLFGDDIPREEQNERLNEIADYVHGTDSSGRAEDFAAIEGRIESFLQDCGQSVERRGGGNVLVVSHALLIRSLVFIYARSRVSDPPKIKNASLTTVVWDDGAILVDKVGDTSHLGLGRL